MKLIELFPLHILRTTTLMVIYANVNCNGKWERISRDYRLRPLNQMGNGSEMTFHIKCNKFVLEQWFVTFFAPWTPKSQKKILRTPNLSKYTSGGSLNSCKKERVYYFTFAIFAGSLDPLPGPPVKNLCFRGSRWQEKKMKLIYNNILIDGAFYPK